MLIIKSPFTSVINVVTNLMSWSVNYLIGKLLYRYLPIWHMNGYIGRVPYGTYQYDVLPAILSQYGWRSSAVIITAVQS